MVCNSFYNPMSLCQLMGMGVSTNNREVYHYEEDYMVIYMYQFNFDFLRL